MVNLMRGLIIAILIIIFNFIGCEKFTGYDYEAESIAVKSRLYGTVRNIYNGNEPVADATVKIGYLTTATDESGYYEVDYIISTDDNRNKPVEIEIAAANFHELRTEFLVFPPESKMDFYMEYGAPIIEQIWIGAPGLILHQVLVTDYQGVDNIHTVTTGIYYTKSGESELKIIIHEMILFKKVSDISAYYYAIAPPTLPDEWDYDPDAPSHIKFEVIDLDGFSDLIDQKYADIMSPEPLFPPDSVELD